MAQVNFDPTKPITGFRFRSEEIRQNFQALGRANDLRCSEQDPPDLTIRAEPGTFAITSNATEFFAGGNSDPIDTTTGGTTGQQRIIVLELDEAGVLQLNTSGAWVTPPVVPVAPNYTSNRIPLCEILVTFDDTEITQDKITDVRPMINLGTAGSGSGLVSPGVVTALASSGQQDFDTSSSFTYFLGQDEILVWSAGVYQTVDEDYIELDSQTIRFVTPRSGGERVTIWKVGLSATPGSIGLADLSDVDGNEADGFNAADSPSAFNPFLTVSGHDAIDHSTIAPIATLLTNQADHFAGTGDRHTAADIDAVDNFTFTNELDVQSVLDDIENNIYQRFLDEHNAGGTHGPKVTISQTNDDHAIDIAHNGGNSAAALQIEKTSGSAECISINKTSTDVSNVVDITDVGGLGSNTIALELQGSGRGISIDVTSTSAGPALAIAHSGIAECISLLKSGTGAAMRITHSNTDSTAEAVIIDNSSQDSAIKIDHADDGAPAVDLVCADNAIGLLVTKTINGSNPGIKIQTNATGTPSDIEGTNANWSILPTGTIQGANFRVGGGAGASSGFLILKPRTAVPVLPPVNGRDTSITVTGSWIRINTLTFQNAGHTVADISRIETAGIEDGTIVIFTWGDRATSSAEPVFRDNNSADNLFVTGNLAMGDPNYSLVQDVTSNNNIAFMKDGSEWIQVAGPSGLSNIS